MRRDSVVTVMEHIDTIVEEEMLRSSGFLGGCIVVRAAGGQVAGEPAERMVRRNAAEPGR